MVCPSIRIDSKMQKPSRRAAQARTSISLHPMNLRRLTIALVLVLCIAAPARDHGSAMPAADLINEVVANELTDRVQQRKWMYVIDKREGKQDGHGRAGGDERRPALSCTCN